MPQLNLNFTDIPIPETCLWEQFDDERKRIVIEALARLLTKAARAGKPRSRPMTDPSKIKATHTQRAAFVYLRQSTPSQVEHNRESTARQYALADKPCQQGWSKGVYVSR